MHEETGARRGRDWVFIAFVAFSTAVFAVTGTQRLRFRRAIAEFAQCAADADTPCAEAVLARLQVMDGKHPRVQIAAAEVHVLLNELRPATLTAAAMASDASLDAVTRGERLLLEGDVAMARGDLAAARQRWNAASGIIDGTLIVPRTLRASKREADEARRASDALGEIERGFRELFDAAEEGQSDVVTLRANDLNQRLPGLQPERARQKLALAIQGAYRVLAAASQSRAASGAPAPPTYGYGMYGRPVEPLPLTESQQRESWYREMHELRMTEYRRQLVEYERREAEAASRKLDRVSQLNEATRRAVGEARALAAEGLDLARTGRGGATP